MSFRFFKALEIDVQLNSLRSNNITQNHNQVRETSYIEIPNSRKPKRFLTSRYLTATCFKRTVPLPFEKDNNHVSPTNAK